ncbi:MAG: endopeptidase La [Bacteroidetes bacterium]|nr:MAG: endopeptidase La [Bacteroidota bacterium]
MENKDDLFTTIKKVESKSGSIPKTLTVLPLRDIIIFPYMIFPVLIGRSSSLKAVAEALERDKFIFVSAQKKPNVDEPKFEDIYTYGTIAKIIQVLRLPNNLLKVLVEGLFQAKIVKPTRESDYLEAEIAQIIYKPAEVTKELNALIRLTSDQFAEYVKESLHVPPDIISAFENIDDPVRKMYFAIANVNQKIETKQKILEKKSLQKQYFELSSILSQELEMLHLEDEIDGKVQDTIQKSQKKYYIQEQIRALQKELGDDDEATPELTAIKDAIEKAGMTEQVKAKAYEEFERLKKTPTLSPEYSVNRTYLELLSSMPWTQKTEDDMDIEHVKTILDEDHYDLEKPKDRILEFIAVLNLAGTLKRQILCFVGPPGVGKTSLAKSIARGLGRKFVRFSLGGIRDEAEIRGHRRTYVGAMPGKIIQSMKKAGTINPVILLDEVDKMSMDFRGDPSSALLEVLDPEQNVAFNDHYLEVDYDLSNVLFITTANVKYDIPLPLQDRMEVIEISSYLEPDKLEIAKRHIVPKILEEYGLDKYKIKFDDKAIYRMIREYTREAGVRHLEREIGSVLRKLARELVTDYDKNRKTRKNGDSDKVRKALRENPQFNKMMKSKVLTITSEKIEELLKAPKFKDKKDQLEDKVGVATGLAWTSIGGETMPVEVTIMPGAEKLTLTGKLGDVMKESAQAALSYVRSNHKVLDIAENFQKHKEIHIHVPEGAIPKDGPSAGITLAIALISAATGKAIKGDIAMTGEITLRGNILPIGGLNEKLLAAKRIGISTVLIPKDNERDVEDINKNIKEGLKIIPIKHISEALPVVFGKNGAKKAKRVKI